MDSNRYEQIRMAMFITGFLGKHLEKATNIDIIDYTKKILEVQDISTKKVSRNCPQFMKNIDLELAKLGGNF